MAMKGLSKPRRLLRLDEQTRRHIVEVFGGYVPPGTIEPALVLVPQGGIQVTIATMDELTSAGPLDIGVMEIACNSLHHTEGTHAQTGEHVRKCAWCDAIEPMLDEVPDKGRLSVRFERVTATRMVPPEGVDPEAFAEERRYMPSAVAPSADCPSLLGVTRDMWVEENGNVMAAIRWNVPPSSHHAATLGEAVFEVRRAPRIGQPPMLERQRVAALALPGSARLNCDPLTRRDKMKGTDTMSTTFRGKKDPYITMPEVRDQLNAVAGGKSAWTTEQVRRLSRLTPRTSSSRLSPVDDVAQKTTAPRGVRKSSRRRCRGSRVRNPSSPTPPPSSVGVIPGYP